MFKLCHEKELPPRQCRVCCHSSPVDDGKWHCSFHKKEISYEEQLKGCANHLFIPSFVAGEIKEVVGNTISYTMKDKSVWVDGKNV